MLQTLALWNSVPDLVGTQTRDIQLSLIWDQGLDSITDLELTWSLILQHKTWLVNVPIRLAFSQRNRVLIGSCNSICGMSSTLRHPRAPRAMVKRPYDYPLFGKSRATVLRFLMRTG